MKGRRLPLGAILLGILFASCGGEPGMSVSVGGENVPTIRTSDVHRTACSAVTSDAVVGEIPLKSLAGRPLLTLTAAGGTTGFRGWIYDVEDGRPSGTPIEEFSVAGASGSYQPRTMKAGRTYEIAVNAEWSFIVTGGSETRIFRLLVEP